MAIDVVHGKDSNELINRATGVCNTLTAADGREFCIVDWHVDVELNRVVSVTAKMCPKVDGMVLVRDNLQLPKDS